ncbi:smg-9, nonsense mediated mRNA decay factor [Bulinus truncatus]|nr:smg-9, nonsense mediated mRNA decay factor [Bulinus truncatus]
MSFNFYELLIFIGFIISSKSLSVDLNLRAHNQIFEECKDVCGSEFVLPCSCSATCVIFNNCCENITLHCPHIVQEGLRLFARQRTSEISCTDYGNFMITSCPSVAHNNLTNETVTVASPHGTTTSDMKHSLMLKLIDIYDNRPVEDVLTGVLYKNLDIFYCNTLQNTNYTIWNVVIGSNKTQDIKKITDILKFVSQALIIYKRPVGIPRKDSPICLNYAEDHCSVFKDLQSLCDSFISYVKIKNKYYKNRFCYLCNNISSNHDAIDPKEPSKWAKFIFSVTFEVTEKEQFRLKFDDDMGGNLLAWRAVTCPMNSVSFSMADGCQVTQCPPAYLLRDDGQCWTMVTLFIGVGIEAPPKSKQEEDKYSEFIACGVQTLFQVDIHSSEKPYYSFYPGSRRTMFVSKTIFYVPNADNIKDTKKFISLIAEIGKTFLKYKDELTKNIPEQVPALNIELKNEFFHSTKTSQYEYLQKVRQRTVFDYTVTVCFRFYFRQFNLNCWEEPIQFSEDFRSEISSSPCFQSLVSDAAPRLNVHLLINRRRRRRDRNDYGRHNEDVSPTPSKPPVTILGLAKPTRTPSSSNIVEHPATNLNTASNEVDSIDSQLHQNSDHIGDTSATSDKSALVVLSSESKSRLTPIKSSEIDSSDARSNLDESIHPSEESSVNVKRTATGSSVGNIISGVIDQGAQTQQKLAPPLEKQAKIKLIDENFQWCESGIELMLDQTDFLVVGVIGLQGCGKSTLLSLLAGNTHQDAYRNYFFFPQTKEGKEDCLFQTAGIDMFVTSERVILLDTQPLLSASMMDCLLRFERKFPSEYTSLQNFIEMQSMQLLTFLLSVCNIILVADDWFIDINFLRLIQDAEMLKPSTQPPSTADSISASKEDTVDFYPTVIFVHNKATREDFSPDTYFSQLQILHKMFISSKLKIFGGINMTNNSVHESIIPSPPGAEDDPACNINLLLIPQMEFYKSDPEWLQSTLPEYRGYPSFNSILSFYRSQILSAPRSPMTHATLSEKNWYHFAARMWETVKKSSLLAEYNRLLSTTA